MSQDLVTLSIDDKEVKVPKGTNLIEAAKQAGVDVPYYCYHPHLSIAGNCRMCQVQVEGQPKLTIGCNTTVAEGMKVRTQKTSKEVADAQAATLEFILINHPLDCTVCDQAGHCKLQDYHYEHNARPSRFLEEKVHKVKAEPLGPTVMLDGERCIMCTRCVRFCEEITETRELGMLNRGDRSVIAVNEGKVLDNPLSGTVVDLCPVGALTHREWRFNTRIWFTKETDAICPGCSTGCNVKVASRDGEVVQVKARVNDAVNKEWLCDEGRYGFMRFLPKARLSGATIRGTAADVGQAITTIAGLKGEGMVILLAPDLITEEYALLAKLVGSVWRGATVALAYEERQLSPVQKILVSPDYAANFRGAEVAGVVSGDLQRGYEEAIQKLSAGEFSTVVTIGSAALTPRFRKGEVFDAIRRATSSVHIGTDAAAPLALHSQVVIGGRSILEKSGILVNRSGRAQYTDVVVKAPDNSLPEWEILQRIGAARGMALGSAASDREVTVAFLAAEPRFAGQRIATIKGRGVPL